jgi:hypothetical protein
MLNWIIIIFIGVSISAIIISIGIYYCRFDRMMKNHMLKLRMRQRGRWIKKTKD